jgi:hypothetical protein
MVSLRGRENTRFGRRKGQAGLLLFVLRGRGVANRHDDILDLTYLEGRKRFSWSVE